jgi:serine/threonine protein kinase
MNSSSRRGLAIQASLPAKGNAIALKEQTTTYDEEDDWEIAQYEKEIKVLRQEYDTQVIQNIRLERDLEDTQAELAEVKEEYDWEQERFNEQIEFLTQGINRRDSDDELDDDDEEEANSDKDNGLHLVDVSLSESPDRVGDYLLGKQIGKGSYAKVHKVIHSGTGKEYAIKCIDKNKIRTVSEAQQLVRELTVLQQITHSNLIHAVQIYNAPNVVYAITELGYTDLREYTRMHKERMTETALQEVMIGVLQAVEFLHDICIGHSDIKTENVLIMLDGGRSQQLTREHIKLCDFGMCTFSSSTDPKDPVYQYSRTGTLPLVAPELLACSNDKPCDARPADMWAVGCMLLELTDGFPDSWHDAYAKVRLSDMHGFQEGLKTSLKEIRGRESVLFDGAFNMVCSLLRLSPKYRRSAARTLHHPWFDGRFKSSEKLVTEGRESI